MARTIRMPRAASLVSGAVTIALVASCAGGGATAPRPSPAAPSVAAAPTTAPATAAVTPVPAAIPTPARSSAATGSATAVHATYLDLARSVGELRARVVQWQGGDEASLSGAKERVERVQAMLGHVAWPDAFRAPIGALGSTMGPLAAAIEKKDVAGAKAPAAELGEASEDLGHAFHDGWLARPEARHTREMDVHTVSLDLIANVTDLRTQIAEWDKGSEKGLREAKEHVERVTGLLAVQAAWPSAMSGPIAGIRSGSPTVAAALTAKDVAKAKAAAAEVGDASHDLAHELYEWMSEARASDTLCLHTGFLDLTATISDMRARVADWQKGSDPALSAARERAERIEAILAHERWPSEVRAPIDAITGKMRPLSDALKAKDAKAVASAANAIGEASHDLAHDFYEGWAKTRMD